MLTDAFGGVTVQHESAPASLARCCVVAFLTVVDAVCRKWKWES